MNPIQKERLKTRFHQAWRWLKPKLLLLWQWITPRALRFLKFLWQNKLYLLWFFVYDIITYMIVSTLLSGGYYYANPEMWQTEQFQLFLVTCFYLFSIFIAMTCGDAILRTLEAVRPIETEEEKEYLNPLFEEICQDVKEKFPEMPKTKLYIIDHQAVNARAIGKRTIAVTQGAIRTFSREELKALIAHEMGHIYYGNTKAMLLNTVGNGVFTLLVIVFKIFLKMLDVLQAPFEKKTSGLISAIIDFIRWLLYLVQVSFLFIGNAILMTNSRKAEYIADKFAYKVGYGRELKEAFYILQRMTLSDQLPIVERMQASHPRISRRIMKIEQLLAKE